jgi:hypothetical protein
MLRHHVTALPSVLLLLCTVFTSGTVPVRAGDTRLAIFVCDSSDDRVVRFMDRDGSGAIEAEAAGEIVSFFDDSSPAADLSIPSHLAADGDGNVYLLDGGTVDAVLVLRDIDGDGTANGADEARVFYDNSSPGPNFSTPNTLLRAPDGSFIVSDDGSSARRLLRLRDGNADGDALDDGEAVIAYAAASAPEPQVMDPEALALAPSGVLFVGDSTQHAVHRFVDLDGNGDWMGAGETNLYFQASEALNLADIAALAVGSDGALYAAEETGLVLRLVDLDGDGDASGEGEASVWLDATAPVPVRDPNDMQLLADGSLLVADGSMDTVFRVQDLNGDGDALDEGEVVRLVLDGGQSLATPSGIAAVVVRDQPPVEERFVRGDVNGDERVDLSDAVSILGYLFLGQSVQVCPDVMDIDDAGDVNISDPIYLLNFLFLGGPALPPPFPSPGPDPSPDQLPCDPTR